MSNRILVSSNRKKKIISITMNEPYILKLKSGMQNRFGIGTLDVYDYKLVQNHIDKKIQKFFSRLLNIINATYSSNDSSPGDFVVCLNEVVRLEKIISFEYKKFMKKEAYKTYIDELIKLRKMLEEKVYMQVNYLEEEESRGIGR